MTLQSLLPAALVTTPYTAIQLAFHTGEAYAPDGDSIRMKAQNPDLWPRGIKRSLKDGTVQARMEGIDAHELHFYGYSQPPRWAEAERDHLLGLLHVPLANPPSAGSPGWTLTRSADVYGRSISFLFPQEVLLKDGAKYMAGDATFLDILRQSANVQMLEDGMAYPMFYEYLPDRLLRLLQGAVTTAKTEKKGFWPEDQTLLGARFLNTDDVEGAVFYPKLARRLFRYFDTLPSGARGMGLRGFREFLKKDPDLLHLASETTVRSLHDPDILEIDEANHRLRLLVPPENLIFHERREENPLLPG